MVSLQYIGGVNKYGENHHGYRHAGNGTPRHDDKTIDEKKRLHRVLWFARKAGIQKPTGKAVIFTRLEYSVGSRLKGRVMGIAQHQAVQYGVDLTFTETRF